MIIKIKQVDAFTKIPFGGNPGGVVTYADCISDEQKQKIAREMNVSETAFVSKSDIADFKIRYFTPMNEVDLCGHCTIATFSALEEEGRLDLSKNVFTQETKSGVLPVEVMEILGEKVFMMTQAVPKFETLEIDRGFVSGIIGLKETDLLDVPIMKVSTGIWWMVVGVKELNKLANVKPDFKAIEAVSADNNVIGITPFCLETFNPMYNYHMRTFAPYVGVNEDPVCGTGNGCVSSYIVHNGLVSNSEEVKLIGEQGIEVGRPGCVHVNIKQKDGNIIATKAGGTAVTVLEGTMRL